MLMQDVFDVVSFLKSSDVNCGPLSDTTCLGSPYAANNTHITSIVFIAEVVFISTTSTALNVRPPAQRTCFPKGSSEIDMHLLSWP